ncbi:Fucolectin-4 [Liparis tanakae]|uniref:Fucolectin-4 n=1 Tax=Liparis tanakae TaxID=230148 RepID=A0A4Z2FDV7_9TELE|nr:Fucolectin-4 [Liparis tanakae]
MTSCVEFKLSLLVFCLQGVVSLWWLLAGSTVGGRNVAPRGTASQSSTYNDYVASRAIDGNADPDLYHGSCSHTWKAGQPGWWRLRLPTAHRVASVSVTNRLTSVTRINDALILVGDSAENNGNNNPRCAVIPSIAAGATRTFPCGGMVGHLVNLYQTKPGAYLSLCEVQVRAIQRALTPTEPTFPHLGAVVGGREVVLLLEERRSWADAVFFCRDFYGELLSIRNEQEQREVEEVLSSASFPLTAHVWVGLRRYLMGGSWFWMSGAPVDYSHWETEPTWQMTSPCGGAGTGDHFHWRDLPCGEHLNFICLTDLFSTGVSTDPPEDHRRVDFYSSRHPVNPGASM